MKRKIYRTIVIDSLTNETLYEDSYEYDGPCDETKGGADARVNSSYAGYSGAAQSQMDFFNTLQSNYGTQFAGQTDTLNYLTGRMQSVMNKGIPGFGLDRFGAGGGDGAGGAGGAGGGGGNGGGGNPLTDPFGQFSQMQSGFNAGDWALRYNPKGYLPQEKAAMQSQAIEGPAQDYQNNMAAIGDKLRQQGIDPSSGVGLQMQQNALTDRAAAESQARRDIITHFADVRNQNEQLAGQLGTQLQMGEGQARLGSAQLVDKNILAEIQMREAAAQAAASRAAASRNARMANSSANARFNAEMALRAASLRSDNFFRAAGVMSGIANQQNPLGYGSLAGQLGGQAGGMYGSMYGQALQDPGHNWGGHLAQGLIGSAIGGGMMALSGGMFGNPSAGWANGGANGWGG